MSPELRAAHERLLQRLPVRTHLQRPQELPLEIRGRQAPNGGVARPVAIDGVKYPSVTAARAKLRTATRRIYEWIRDGRARYIDATTEATQRRSP